MNDLEQRLQIFENLVYFHDLDPNRRPMPGLPDETQRLQQSLRRLAAIRADESRDLDEMIHHVACVIEQAPYLSSAESHYILMPDDQRHQLLREAWHRAKPTFRCNPEAMRNACHFCLRWNAAEAASAIEAALADAPREPLILQAAGEYFFQGTDLGWANCSFQLALDYFELARNLNHLDMPAVFLGQAAMAAFEVDAMERARELAEAATEPHPLRGFENPHLGHSVKGRLALRVGNVEEAVKEFVASSCEHWCHWGPSLRLARELAIRGRVEEVRSFLQSVIGSKGQRPPGVAEAWLSALEAGRFEELRNPGR